jgi:outer membrane protein assembly factor BamB
MRRPFYLAIALLLLGTICSAETVRVDELDAAGRARLQQVDDLLAKRQWNEAVEILRQAAETGGDKLISVSPGHYISLNTWCRRRLAALPPEALKIYRGLVDASAGEIYRQGIARREERLLLAVADRHRASSFGEAALWALGEIEFECGNFAAARRYWRRILADDGSKGLPPQLENLLAESSKWKIADTDWPTFAGNPRRNGIAQPLPKTLGKIVWRLPLECPRTFPAAVGKLLFFCNPREVSAVRIDGGASAWGNSPVIYRTQYADAERALPPSDASFSSPQTLTVFDGRLFARLGPAATGELVALDLAAEGRLLWSRPAEEGWTWEGSPVADSRGVYASMRSREPRPRAAVVCLDAETGRLRWRRIVCTAESLDRDELPPPAENLLSLDEGMIYYDTALGAAAALRTIDGRIEWVREVSPRPLGEGQGGRERRRRGPYFCLGFGDVVYVAPANNTNIFALHADDGAILWQNAENISNAGELLGVDGHWLIVGGERLCWLSLDGDNRGKAIHVRPESAEVPGRGRGLPSGDCILWPAGDKLYVFDRRTAEQLAVHDLATLGTTGGNILLAGNRLLIAAEKELVALQTDGEQSK